MSTEINTLVPVEEMPGFIVDLTQPRTVSYSSWNPESMEEKKQLFNASNNPIHRIKDEINMRFKIKHIYCEVVDCVNRDTGEVNKAPRIVLIDENGEGHTCCSLGIFSAIKKLLSSLGEPTTWPEPVEIEIKQINKEKDRSTLTFNII